MPDRPILQPTWAAVALSGTAALSGALGRALLALLVIGWHQRNTKTCERSQAAIVSWWGRCVCRLWPIDANDRLLDCSLSFSEGRSSLMLRRCCIRSSLFPTATVP